MSIMLYTTHCPKCKVLAKKLDKKKVKYEVCDNMKDIIALGFTSAPILVVDEKEMLFEEAVKWVDEQ